MTRVDIMVTNLFDVISLMPTEYRNYSLKHISALKQWIWYTYLIAYAHMLHKLQYLPTSLSEDSAIQLVIWYRYSIC